MIPTNMKADKKASFAALVAELATKLPAAQKERRENVRGDLSYAESNRLLDAFDKMAPAKEGDEKMTKFEKACHVIHTSELYHMTPRAVRGWCDRRTSGKKGEVKGNSYLHYEWTRDLNTALLMCKNSRGGFDVNKQQQNPILAALPMTKSNFKKRFEGLQKFARKNPRVAWVVASGY